MDPKNFRLNALFIKETADFLFEAGLVFNDGLGGRLEDLDVVLPGLQ